MKMMIIISALGLIFLVTTVICVLKLRGERKRAREWNRFLLQNSYQMCASMNRVIGMAELGKKHIVDVDRVKYYYEGISASAREMSDYLDNMFDLVSLYEEKMTFISQQFNFRDMLSSLSSVFYSRCRAKRVRFGFEIEDSVGEVLAGDMLRCEQIMTNVLSYACHCTGTGNVKVVVREKERTEKLSRIVFKVKDTGKDMADKTLSLTLAERLTRQMGGKYSARYIKGQGHVYEVELTMELVKDGHTVPPSQFAEVRALVVNENVDMAEYTAELLGKTGMRIDVVQSEEAALAMIRNTYAMQDGYDLCFLDWTKPGVFNRTVPEEIRKRFGTDTVIVVISAYGLYDIKKEMDEIGADIYVHKPLMPYVVYKLLLAVRRQNFERLHNDDRREYDFEKKKVLLVEDFVFNAEIIIDMLDRANVTTEHVQSGSEALGCFLKNERGTYAAVLMDIQLPDWDGYKVSRKIRASGHPDAASIPIYAVTADSTPADIVMGMRAGMNGHISKPVDADDLYRMLWRGIYEK